MSVSPEEREQKQKSSAIDRQLRVDLKDYENTIKILLLGQLVKSPPIPLILCRYEGQLKTNTTCYEWLFSQFPSLI